MSFRTLRAEKKVSTEKTIDSKIKGISNVVFVRIVNFNNSIGTDFKHNTSQKRTLDRRGTDDDRVYAEWPTREAGEAKTN